MSLEHTPHTAIDTHLTMLETKISYDQFMKLQFIYKKVNNFIITAEGTIVG